jgi:hypothetical protein
MTIESDYKALEESHRAFLVAYTVLTTKKIKSKAPEARKALMGIIEASKSLRKSVQEFKEKI